MKYTVKNYISKTIGTTLFLLSTAAFASTPQYTIFIDAGSTGSRVHIFQYDTSATLPTIQDVFSESAKPGLSSFATHPNEAGNSLKTILDDATAFLKKNNTNLKDVPISVLATAGMRLLPEAEQKAIYANVTNYIKTNYIFPVGKIETISGKMEGVYGWLDINYLLGNFKNGHPTSGSIDMGGASTQIAFETKNASKPNDEVQIKLNNKRYIIFSKSFLGLGQDQALNSMNAYPVANRCYPKDYAFNSTSVGYFNMAACGSIYTNIIQDKKVEQQMIRAYHQSFVAFSGVYYAYEFFNVLNEPGQFSVDARIQSVCNNSWDQLKKEYPDVPEKYLSTYCANGVYISQLIYNTYKLKGYQLTVTNKINQKDIDWSLGAALYSLVQKS